MSVAGPRKVAGTGWASGEGARFIDLDKSTEEFRKKLAAADAEKKATSQPSVKGGLPPHLLRQQSEMGSTSVSIGPLTDHRTSSPLSGFGQYSGGTYPQKDPPESQPRPQLQFHVQQQQRQSHAPPQSQSRPSNALTSRVSNQHCQQQPPRSRPVRAFIANSREQAPRAPTYASTQTSEAGHSLMDSRWAETRPGPFQVQKKHHQPQKEADQPAGAAVGGGIRMSAKAYGDWSPFHHNSEQQQATGLELLHVTAQQQKKRWQPKNGYDSSQDLPESCESSLRFNDDEDSNRSFDGNDAPHDVRGTMAGDLDLVLKKYGGGFYNKNTWNEYPEDPEDPQGRKWRPTYCQLWVKEMEAYSPWPVARHLYITGLQHEECDVETSNGWLMPPIPYPQTGIDPEDIKTAVRDDNLARREQGTANLKIRANYHKYKRRVEEREAEQRWETNSSSSPPVSCSPGPSVALPAPKDRKHLHATDSTPHPTGQPTPPTTQPNTQGRRPPTIIPGKTVWHPIYGKVYHEPKVIENHEPPTFLKTSCFLRPAEEDDLPQILDIYNWEVAHGMQALDTSALDLKDMKSVFKQCEDSKTPMIVAIAGSCSDSIARRKQPPRAQPRGRGPQQQAHPAGDEVLGFAFISIMSHGLGGDIYRNVGRFTGQVHIYVAHDKRRKGIGRALLQQTTVFCSRHASVGSDDFEWYDRNKSARFEDAFYNTRGYSRIFIHFASRGTSDPDQQWMTKFLDTENFICVSTMDKSRKVGYGDGGQMLDTLVYQHDCCQDPQNMEENDPELS